MLTFGFPAPKPHEQALRSLVRFFNTQHYGQHAPGLHRRSSSVPTNPNEPSPDFTPGPVASVPLPPLSPHGPPPDYPGAIEDVFPPPRAISSIDVDAKVPLKMAYGAVDLSEDLEGYEVDDLLAASGQSSSHATAPTTESAGGSGTATPEGPATTTAQHGQSEIPQVNVVDHDDLLDFLNDPLGSFSDAAWERLGLEGYEGEWDDVSDSESVGGWGFMRFGVDERSSGLTGTVADDGEEVLDEQSGRIEWEHIRSVLCGMLILRAADISDAKCWPLSLFSLAQSGNDQCARRGTRRFGGCRFPDGAQLSSPDAEPAPLVDRTRLACVAARPDRPRRRRRDSRRCRRWTGGGRPGADFAA